MFFRREKPHIASFAERLEKLKRLGFQIQPASGGVTRVARNGCAADLTDKGAEAPQVSKAGVLVGGEVGLLVDLGFQKIFETPGGKKIPAQAGHLRALHEFQEDLKEGLGLTSLYNEGLGTVNDLHRYDRVVGRDAAPKTKPWERAG